MGFFRNQIAANTLSVVFYPVQLISSIFRTRELDAKCGSLGVERTRRKQATIIFLYK